MDRLYPIGIQTFETIRKEGYCYVDKTGWIYRLVKSGKYYFLSRPRRFGKSLLISTLEAYFRGKKELFTGLAIDKLEQDWTEYPVLHLDLNARLYEKAASLVAILNQHLEQWEAIYGDEKKDRAPEERFAYLIEKISRTTGRQVAVLVDEYDKPLLQAIGNPALQNEYRNQLKAFYGVLKSRDAYLRFALLTGVTKFSKLSVFSDLNNLQDISMDDEYAPICGITEQELHAVFGKEIRLLSKNNGMNEDETKQKLKELLRQGHYDLYNLYNEQVSKDMLGDLDNIGANPLPILYQSGYLTLKEYDREFDTYALGFPNREVAEGFNRHLLMGFAQVPSGNKNKA